MALSVTSYEPADWFANTGTTRSVTGVAWNAGDIIIAIGGTENASYTLGTPTNANLTFSLAASVTTGAANECTGYVWTATAGSSQTGQTITTTISSSGKMGGLHIWVVAGGPTGTTGAVANQTETAPSLTVAAGDVVCFGLFDWNASNPPGKTPATGSGTATERSDVGNGSEYATWCADWVGTAAGSFSFGPNNYTGLKVAQAAIVVQAPAATDTDADAGHAAGTGAASNAAANVRPAPSSATGTGAAANAAANVRPAPSSAGGTGVAHAAVLALGLLAGAATGAGTAHPAAAAVAPVVAHAAGTGQAFDARIVVTVPAGHASGAGAAHDATTTAGGGATNVDAGHASGTGTAHDATVSPGLWQTVTNDFTDAPGDNFLNGGNAPSYVDGRAVFDVGASDGSLSDFTDRSLDGSYVHVKAQPNPSYGYLEMQLTRSAGGTLVASVFKRADQSTLGIFHNGSTVATPTYDPATMRFWRWRAAGTTLYAETSPDTVTWTERWSGTSPFDLTTLEVVLNGGSAVGGQAPSTGVEFAYFSRFNLPDVDTYPTAGHAAGTGTAHGPAATVAPTAGHAAGTGTAYDATVSTSGTTTNVNAGHASGTGTAHNATVRVAPGAGHAAGTGAAYFDVGSQVSLDLVQDTPTAGTGAAYDADPAVAVRPSSAAGTGVAHDATVSTTGGAANPAAGHAAGTGTAHPPAATIAPTAGHAAGTGTAHNATVTTIAAGNAPAEAATGTGQAHNPGVSATPRSVATATGTGQAYDATVSTASTATAPAGLAAGTGTAHNATVRVDVRPSSATGTGTAHDASGPAAFAITSPVRARIVASSGVRAVIADTSGVRARIITT